MRYGARGRSGAEREKNSPRQGRPALAARLPRPPGSFSCPRSSERERERGKEVVGGLSVSVLMRKVSACRPSSTNLHSHEFLRAAHDRLSDQRVGPPVQDLTHLILLLELLERDCEVEVETPGVSTNYEQERKILVGVLGGETRVDLLCGTRSMLLKGFPSAIGLRRWTPRALPRRDCWRSAPRILGTNHGYGCNPG